MSTTPASALTNCPPPNPLSGTLLAVETPELEAANSLSQPDANLPPKWLAKASADPLLSSIFGLTIPLPGCLHDHGLVLPPWRTPLLHARRRHDAGVPPPAQLTNGGPECTETSVRDTSGPSPSSRRPIASKLFLLSPASHLRLPRRSPLSHFSSSQRGTQT